MDMAMRRGQGLKSFGLGAIIVACGAMLVGLQQSRLASLKSSDQLTPEIVERQAIAEKTNLELWKTLPAYGYDNLFADWAFLRFLQYFGDDDARNLGNYRLSPEFFEIVIDRDPWFSEGYRYLSASSSLYAGMPDRTVAIMNRGLEKMSPKEPESSYYIWRLKAVDEQLFLGNIPAAIASYLTAAEWADYYTDEKSKQVAQQSRGTAAFLIRNPSSLVAQSSAWSLVLVRATDDKTRQYVLQEIEKIGGKVEFKPGGSVSITMPKKVIEAEEKALGIKN